MDFRQLRTFVHVAEHGSFRAASAQLNTAQSALTRQIQLLEADLNARLFDRHGRGVTLTARGTSFLPRARQILLDVNNARLDARSDPLKLGGTVRISLPFEVATIVAPRLMERVLVSCPQVQLVFRTGMGGEGLGWLHQEHVDLVIPCHSMRGNLIRSRTLGSERLLLASRTTRNNHTVRSLSADSILPLDRLFELPLILPSASNGLRQLIDSAAANVGHPICPKIEVDCLQTALSLVEDGFGQAIVPECVSETLSSRQNITLTGVSPLRRNIDLVQPIDRHLEPAALHVSDILVDELKKVFGALPASSIAVSEKYRDASGNLCAISKAAAI